MTSGCVAPFGLDCADRDRVALHARVERAAGNSEHGRRLGLVPLGFVEGLEDHPAFHLLQAQPDREQIGGIGGRAPTVGREMLAPDLVLLSGEDLGFRMVGLQGDKAVGVFVVRVDGKWLTAAPALELKRGSD